ncbi:uncharacterized protein [Physcomitrium patens]|uniref:OVATE domain-containing protein n=1 Tax=Physcomitrium patens TaxID=3218 RepID=A0A2K1L084_PHYPA|nr:uncharacterized protein LOC112279001 isoform X1 [Physcomitrium patens]XP_024368783.1 uncharacterized protein LOC112279001 isoform X1 [Physcomitrium patens]XP_024368784.1 uncharacterized protein LOC112279001 isoform X1 [Physcomitrium patens]XP_024368785.1 uncharacterized protein LOC112279001 isoform X1 [Physcomitrium patens]XP_024368786.1 uncharacterized protein LOC112279001 isoform X1 [Physcomitrium patens]XP_024368787.1 uncharacterized protein LOC112279001 isoform X1 [Physcomitrium patens]|eukprot:XP_024368782.1 uncharacterized protein LOC112279001 isoform X1 [Physcomitrella patens]
MDASREKYFLMSKKMSTKGAEKLRGKHFSAVFPTVWLIKLRSICRNSRSLKASNTTELVIPDSSLFLPKVVENCYKHGALKSGIYTFSPVQHPQAVTNTEPSNPWLEYRVANAVTASSTQGLRSKMASSEGTTRFTPLASVANTSSSRASIFSRCLSKLTSSSRLRGLSKLVGDQSVSRKRSNSSEQFRKTTTPTRRARFSVGCGSTSRRRSRRSSLQLEESALIGMDIGSGLDCIEEGKVFKDSWPTKSKPWLTANPIPWSGEPKNGEVVKNQMVMKKFTRNREVRGVKVKSPVKLKSGCNPTLGHLFSAEADTDSPKKINPETKEEPEVLIDNPKMCTFPWRSTSFGTDCNFKAPRSGSECGFGSSERKPTSFLSEFEPPATCKEGLDDCNFSNGQSLLKQKVLPAEWLREGSKSLRDQQKTNTKLRDESEMKLLASLHQALDSSNLQRLIGDEDDGDPGNESILIGSTCEPHNSPAFESFLESSAKAWGVKFPIHRDNYAKSNELGSTGDKSRELHCITVQPASQLEDPREPACERNRVERKIPRAARNNLSWIAKRQKAKYPGNKKVFKKPSPSRKLVPKDLLEERNILAHCEESMIDPELHEDLNHARRKFNEAKRRTKQRRSTHIASVPSPPAPSTKQLASAPKERVAIVVESSYDPYNDFRQSMIEMIVDQDIKEADDLEELLKCYLSLNEAEHHNVIVDVFTDVWHEIFESKI